MTVFVRPARAEDSPIFTEWYLKSPSFDSDVIRFPESYTLCAFKKGKILGFMVVRTVDSRHFQVLNCFVPNPEATELEKAAASRELVKQVFFLGYLKQIPEIVFVGDHPETNRIAHCFEPADELQTEFNTNYPVFKCVLKDIEG